MKTSISVLLLAALVTCLCVYAPSLTAQEKKSQMYFVGCDVVNPYMDSKYDTTVKEQVALFDKYKWPYPFSVYATNDYCYYYLTPVKDFTEIGNSFKAAEELIGKAGIEWKAIYAKFTGVVQSTTFSVFTFTPELSYTPASPRLKQGEGNFVIIDEWYALVGKEEDFENHIKELVALMKKRNVTAEWDAFVGGLGTEQPLYAFAARDTNMADFWAHNADMWKALGKEGGTLFDKLQACTRKHEWKFAWYQPELSYTPKEKNQPK